MKHLPFSTEADIMHYADSFQTPFYIYDQKTIESQCVKLKRAFAWAEDFQNFFAVKATPNPHILRIIKDQGFGVDCSSYAELLLAEAVGFENDLIFFTSNNATLNDYEKALQVGAVINFDDASHLHMISENLHTVPQHISVRYNPGPLRRGNQIIGEPANSKFGVTKDQLFTVYEDAQKLGCNRFSLHTMIVSNCLDEDELVQTAEMMFNLIVEIKEKLRIPIHQVNLGGGIGIPYKPDDVGLDLNSVGQKIMSLYKKTHQMNNNIKFKIAYECGRFITGPAGILVTKVINKKTTYRNYLGVDATMANLMRPALYGAYHHITHIKGNDEESTKLPEIKNSNGNTSLEANGVYDVVGSLCENNDKLATGRFLGCNVSIGDVLVFHDAGAHGSAMGFNYNGKLRCAEYLLRHSESPFLIRRAETYTDLFATIVW